MVKRVNKKNFIVMLQEKTKLKEQECILVNDIFESCLFWKEKNKERIIINLQRNLNIPEKEAAEIYSIGIQILSSSLKRKIRHPFGS